MGFWSDVVDWFTGEAEKPAEPLVLGAELKCPWGTSHSYLYVGSDNIDINNLPQAHVEDCIAYYNITPFGKCIYRIGQPCELCFCLADRWENSEPQNVIVNGREIITTKSTLICQTSGTEIKAVTTGQDALYAKELILYKEMNENYPGLLEILLDPHGSLYLDGEMYETAFKFLDDCLVRHGGELSFEFIYGGVEPEGKMIRAILERLNPDYLNETVANNTAFLSQLDMSITSFESMKADGRARAEEIRADPIKRWFEAHKKFTSELKEEMEQAVCAAILCSSIVTVAPIEGTPGSLVPQAGTGGAGVPATINPDLNEYYIIGALPGGMQPQLPVLGGGNTGGNGSATIDEIIDSLPETTNGKGVARNFESRGGFDQTIRDFESLNPTDVRDIQTQYGSGKVGKLSDGTTVVARPGSTTGGATLEIRVSNSKVYKIRY